MIATILAERYTLKEKELKIELRAVLDFIRSECQNLRADSTKVELRGTASESTKKQGLQTLILVWSG